MAVEPQLDVLTALGYGTGRPTTWRHQGKQPLHSHEFFDNYLIRFLLGPNVWAGPLSFINETHADLALNVLKKFDFVGTLEHNGVDKLAACVGWNTSQPAPQFNRFQRATKRPLDGALQHALTQHNRLDTELWQWIAERDQQCPIEWTKLEAQEEELINDKVWALKDAGNGAWSSTNNLLPNMQISVDMDDRYTFLVGQMTLLHEKMNKVLGEIQHLKSERILTASAVTNSPTKTAIKRPVIPRALIPQATTKARSPADLKRENDTFRSMLVSMEKLQFDTQHRLILNLTVDSSRVIQQSTKFRFKPTLSIVGERRVEDKVDGRQVEAVSIRGVMHSGTRWIRQSINARFSKRLRYSGFKLRVSPNNDSTSSSVVVCDADGLYGWKHGLIDRHQLQQLEENNHVMIVTFLHLWPFLFRQRRQPYVKKTELPLNAPLTKFMQYKPTTDAFDPDYKFPFVPYKYENYIQMRSAKYRNFLWAMSQSKRVVGVRYEDLISQSGNHMQDFLDSFDKHYGVTVPGARVRQQRQQTYARHSKSGGKQWKNAVEHYLSDAKNGLAMFQNTSGFGWSSFGLSNLDHELERILGYVYPTTI